MASVQGQCYKGFLFDLNGTMVDDMELHLHAWFEILHDQLGSALTRDEVKQQMYGKNDELLIRVFGEGHFSTQQMDEISLEKEARYQRNYRPRLQLIAGLYEFLLKAESEQILLAIGSAAIPFNIDFVLDNLLIRHFFKAIISADDVQKSKPHPETFLKAAALLGISPRECLVFEDAPKGVEAALNAEMKAVVLTTTHAAEAFAPYPNVLHFIADYQDPILRDLI